MVEIHFNLEQLLYIDYHHQLFVQDFKCFALKYVFQYLFKFICSIFNRKFIKNESCSHWLFLFEFVKLIKLWVRISTNKSKSLLTHQLTRSQLLGRLKCESQIENSGRARNRGTLLGL